MLRRRPGAVSEVLRDPVAAGVEGSAHAIRRLQRGWTTRRDQREIETILTAFTGADLLALKTRLNLSEDKHDLEELIFRDIGDDAVRERVLEHIAREAQRTPVSDVKVLCDVDDTVRCSLHDERYPSGAVYPGALAFLEALDHGTERSPSRIGDLTFLSARPRDLFGVIENLSRDSLRRIGTRSGSMLTGTFLGLRSHRGMAEAKLDNVARYHRIFPEYGMVFIGDSGQGDIDVARQVGRQYAAHLRGAFIHDVTGLDAQARRNLADNGVHVFDSYVAAAAQAHRLGLVDADTPAHIAEQARRDLDAIEFDSAEQHDAALALIDRDAEAAARGDADQTRAAD